jgi:hypothetical protein
VREKVHQNVIIDNYTCVSCLPVDEVRLQTSCIPRAARDSTPCWTRSKQGPINPGHGAQAGATAYVGLHLEYP